MFFDIKPSSLILDMFRSIWSRDTVDCEKNAFYWPNDHALNQTLQWVYNRDIADLGQAERIPNCVENLYNDVHAERQYNLMGYKNSAFAMAPDGQHFVKLQKEQTAPQR